MHEFLENDTQRIDELKDFVYENNRLPGELDGDGNLHKWVKEIRNHPPLKDVINSLEEEHERKIAIELVSFLDKPSKRTKDIGVSSWMHNFSQCSYLIETKKILPFREDATQLYGWLKHTIEKFLNNGMPPDKMEMFAPLYRSYELLSSGATWSQSYYDEVMDYISMHGYLPERGIGKMWHALRWVRQQIAKMENDELSRERRKRIEELTEMTEFRTLSGAIEDYNNGVLQEKYFSNHIQRMGRLSRRKTNTKWTEEALCELAKKHNCAKDMALESLYAYHLLKRDAELYESCTRHWEVEFKVAWSNQKLCSIARECTSRSEMFARHPEAYRVLTKSEIANQCTAHWIKEPAWRTRSDEELCKIARSYATRTDMQKGDPSAYNELRRRGSAVSAKWTEHWLKKSTGQKAYWTEERLWSVAKKYKSQMEMRKNSSAAFFALIRNKELEAKCKAWWFAQWSDEELWECVKSVDSDAELMRRFPEQRSILAQQPEKYNEFRKYWQEKFPLEEIRKIASGCKNKTEFKTTYPHHYQRVAADEKFFDELKHLWTTTKKITDERLYTLATIYDSSAQLRENEMALYRKLSKNKPVFERVRAYWKAKRQN